MKTGKVEYAPDYKSDKKNIQERTREAISKTKRSICAGFSADEFKALVEWMRDPNRKPPHIAFTAGHVRDAARAFEDAQR